MSEGQDSYTGWAILELMGHRRLAGRISEGSVGGVPLLRIDVYVGSATAPEVTQFYGSPAIYCVTPSTEELCRRMAVAPALVSPYELPALDSDSAMGQHFDPREAL